MRKIVIIILIALILIQMNLFNYVSATNEAFTAEDAIALFEGANVLFTVLQNGDAHGLEEDVYLRVDETDTIYLDEVGHFPWDAYKRMISYHYKDSSYEIDTEEKLKNLVGIYYSVNMIETFVDFWQEYDEYLPAFHVNEKGYIYYIARSYTPWGIYKVVDSSNFIINGNTATINLNMCRYGGYDIKHYLNVPVEFVRTDEGWRLADIVFDELYGTDAWREYVYKTPNTGDNTLPTAALLATVALAAVITPFALSKKRRVR